MSSNRIYNTTALEVLSLLVANIHLGPHGTSGCLSAYLMSLDTCNLGAFGSDYQ